VVPLKLREVGRRDNGAPAQHAEAAADQEANKEIQLFRRFHARTLPLGRRSVAPSRFATFVLRYHTISPDHLDKNVITVEYDGITGHDYCRVQSADTGAAASGMPRSVPGDQRVEIIAANPIAAGAGDRQDCSVGGNLTS
jgi:hypothetical protein